MPVRRSILRAAACLALLRGLEFLILCFGFPLQSIYIAMDLSKSGLEYQNTVVLSTRSIIRKSPDTFRRFMRAYSTALAIFHQQREATLKVMAKHLKGIDPFILEKSYEAYKAWVPEIPYLNHAGMETAIALTPGVEKGREVKVPDIVDESFIKELDQQGFYRTLYKK